MKFEIISGLSLERRKYWISEIVKLSGNFGQDYTRVEAELSAEVEKGGVPVVLDHLRLAGAIPEAYGHDSSEEKLYSKYTDALLAITFRTIGLKSIVLTERADAADVEVFADNYAFVADAKAFRLTRTAKNQKDFKVQAMDGWRRDKKYALVIAPLYQMPATSSQIYQQAIARDVCLLSYSHLAILINLSVELGNHKSQKLLTNVLTAVSTINPTKDATAYWSTINKVFLSFDPIVQAMWKHEKIANMESIAIAKEEGLNHLALLRERIVTMSHDEAIRQLIVMNKIDSKVTLLNKVIDNGLLGVA